MIQDAATFVVNTGASDGDFAEPVSKTRSLMEFENRFRTLCAASLAGVYIVQDGRIKYANAAFAQMLASEPDELNGSPFLAFVHPDDRARVAERGRRRLSGEETTSRYEARCVRKDGKIVHVEVLGSRVDYGGTPALIGTILDVSDQKRAVSALEDRLRFEKLLVDLWVGFVNVPPKQCDETLGSSLKMLVEFLGNDRGTLTRFSADKDHVLVTHSHAAPRGSGFLWAPGPWRGFPGILRRCVGAHCFCKAPARRFTARGAQGKAVLCCPRHQVQCNHSAQGRRLGARRNRV